MQIFTKLNFQYRAVQGIFYLQEALICFAGKIVKSLNIYTKLALCFSTWIFISCASTTSFERYANSQQAMDDMKNSIGMIGYRNHSAKLVKERLTAFEQQNYIEVSSIGKQIIEATKRKTTKKDKRYASWTYGDDYAQVSASMADQAYFELAMGNTEKAQSLFYAAHENIFAAAQIQEASSNDTVNEMTMQQLRTARLIKLTETLASGYSLAQNDTRGWSDVTQFKTSLDEYVNMLEPVEFEYPDIESIDSDNIRFPVYRPEVDIESPAVSKFINKPFEAIGRVEIVQGNKTSFCTGVVVQRNIVLTNGHCVTNKDGTARSVSTIKFYLEASVPKAIKHNNRRSIQITAYLTQSGLNKAWDGDRLHDWALLKTTESFEYWLNWESPNTEPLAKSDTLFLAGYSGDLTSGKYLTVEWGCSMVELEEMSLTANTPDHYNFRHNCDSAPGSSGSALIKYARNKNWQPSMNEAGLFSLKIVGLHHSGVKGVKDHYYALSKRNWSEEYRKLR